MRIATKTIKDFPWGTIDTLEDRSLPDGAASRSINWITSVDKIELRRGYGVLGNEISGTGKITGLYVATKRDGTEIAYRTRGKKLEYLATDTWTEVDADVLGAAAEGKDISFAEYHPTAGDYLYINSPYGPFLKIDLDTPGSATDVYDVAKNHKGYIRIKQNRMFLWGRTADTTSLYLSKIDNLEDFTWSTPRVASEGDVVPQGDGGNLMDVLSFGADEYCIHESKIWVLTLGIDDTTYTNYIYRERTGMPTFRSGISTKNGIYFIDDADKKDPQGRVVTIDLETAEKLVLSVSQGIRYKKKMVGLNLADYSFDKAITFEWGNYILFAFRQTTSSENDRVLLYDKNKKTLDMQDYWVSCMAIYGGTLIAGDPSTDNVYTLFSLWDDDDALIINYWEGNKDNLGWEGLQTVKKLIIEGDIGVDQELKISASIDNGTFVEIGTIKGSGSYVDRGQSVSVGSLIIGSREVGGGSEGASAYHYKTELSFGQDKFDDVKLRFECLGLGYCSISSYAFDDIRIKSKKIASKYRS